MAADSNALIASLLLGQKQRESPLDIYRKFGQQQIQAGSSTAPLGSGNPLEGIARALQGGIGGLVQGYGMGMEEQRGKNTVALLGDLYNAPDEAARSAIIQKAGNIDTDIAGPIIAQLLWQKQQQDLRNKAGDAFVAGYGGAPATPQQQQAGGVPQPGYAASTAPGSLNAGGPNPNNIGNVRPNGASTGFQQPPDFNAGVNLAVNNVKAYPAQFNNGQPMTLAQIGAKWAPAGDGANDPMQWAKNVSTHSGLPLDQPLDLNNPQVAASFARGVHGAEWGAGAVRPVTDYAGALAQGGQAAPVGPGQIAAPPQLAQGDALPPAAPSASSEPPVVPKPRPSAEQLQRYRGLMAGPNGLTTEQASQGLSKEINDQWHADQLRATQIWQDQQQSKRQNEKAALDLGQKAPMEMISRRVDNYENKILPAARAANDSINTLHQVRQALDAGAFTGTGAEAKLAAAKVGEFLGIPSDQAVNTQVLGSVLSKQILSAAGGSLGNQVSNADAKIIANAAGGSITIDEKALRQIADAGERVARLTLKNHDTEAARIQRLPGIGQLGSDQFTLQHAPTYQEWAKANPPLQGQQGGPVAAQTDIPTVQTPDEARKLPKGTQFKTPDGRLLTVP